MWMALGNIFYEPQNVHLPSQAQGSNIRRGVSLNGTNILISIESAFMEQYTSMSLSWSLVVPQ